MKICSPQLGISSNSSLGGEIYDYQTLKGFTEKGAKVFVYLPKNRPYDKSLKNFKVDYCFMTHIVPPWIYSFICLPYLFKTYKKQKFDILRIHSPRFLGLAAIIFHLFYPKVPILASQVTVDASPVFFPIEWLTFKISKSIIVQSNYMKNLLIRKYRVDPGKINVTYGGLLQPKETTRKVAAEANNLKPNDPIILFMGVLIKRKNPIFLVDLLKQSQKKIPKLNLVIIGDGPQKNEIERSVKEKKLSNSVVLLKSAYGTSKEQWLNRMNIFLMPSNDEAFGLSVTEAMSFAKPVITSNRAAFKEIITNGKDGFTIPIEDKEKWVDVIVRLIQSPKLSKEIGINARKTVQNKFNWQRTYNLNFKVARKLLNEIPD